MLTKIIITVTLSIIFSALSIFASKFVLLISKKIRLEIVKTWLEEISSDIFRGGITQSVNFLASSFLNIIWGINVIGKTIPIGFCFIFASLIISLISSVYEESKRFVENSNSMSAKDKSITLTIIPIIASIARYLNIFLWFIGILNILGVDIAPIISGSALILAVVGFAGQSVLQDLIGFLSLIVDRPYYVGSTIEFVFDNHKELGTVEQISIRNTIIKNSEGYCFYIPNRDVKNFRVHKK